MRPPFDSVQLVQISPMSLWFMVLITILVTGAYKPTFTSLRGLVNHTYHTIITYNYHRYPSNSQHIYIYIWSSLLTFNLVEIPIPYIPSKSCTWHGSLEVLHLLSDAVHGEDLDLEWESRIQWESSGGLIYGTYMDPMDPVVPSERKCLENNLL